MVFVITEPLTALAVMLKRLRRDDDTVLMVDLEKDRADIAVLEKSPHLPFVANTETRAPDRG